MGTLYVVATPIGNLEDITLRALRILKEVDGIACEDTRQTQKLLSHFQIKKSLVSYHQHSQAVKTDQIIKQLEAGKNVALVSDAGTPGISDPGFLLVQEAFRHQIKVVTIPGPSALVAAAAIAGVPVDKFVFLGFLPSKKGREKIFHEIADEKRTVIFYESPHRLMKTLDSLAQRIHNREVVVSRELTKIFEEIVRGSPPEILQYFEAHPDKVRGEFVIIIAKK